MSRARTAVGLLTCVASIGSMLVTVHTLVNLRLLRRPPLDPPPVVGPVSVLMPVRDEAHQVAHALACVLDQVSVEDLEVVVLDDSSRDGTAEAALAAADADPRVRVLTGQEPPPGWLGKTYACHQLAREARGEVLVFVDADVRLAPHAVAAAVAVLRGHDLDLVSPYPRQIAEGLGERLVQPLLQWSWAATLPLRLAERSPRPSLAAANGQFLVVDAETYRRAGGHHAVRAEVLDDVALLRAVKLAGGRGGVIDGTGLAVCRMYTSWADLREGYSKSLWSAFGSPAGAAAVGAGFVLLFVVPPVAALAGSRLGLFGYLCAVAGRYAVAERTGGRSLPDSFAHPVSIALFTWLLGRSWRGRRRGTLTWKGRFV